MRWYQRIRPPGSNASTKAPLSWLTSVTRYPAGAAPTIDNWTPCRISGRSAVRYASVSDRSEEHTSELQSQSNLVCRLLLEKKKKKKNNRHAGDEDLAVH